MKSRGVGPATRAGRRLRAWLAAKGYRHGQGIDHFRVYVPTKAADPVFGNGAPPRYVAVFAEGRNTFQPATARRRNRQLADMGMPVIRVWDSSLQGARRERTLVALRRALQRARAGRAVRL